MTECNQTVFPFEAHFSRRVVARFDGAQINTLFHNKGNGKFVGTTKLAGPGFQTPYVGRGVAFADFDNDGFMDLVVANNGDAPLLLRNMGGDGGHFLNLKLVGHKSNRDAMGTRIRETCFD